jgi:hypothetical protein
MESILSGALVLHQVLHAVPHVAQGRRRQAGAFLTLVVALHHVLSPREQVFRSRVPFDPDAPELSEIKMGPIPMEFPKITK